MYSWDGAVFAWSSEDIPTHGCGDFTEEGFYEPNPKEKYLIYDSYSSNMRCIDDNDKYKLFGKLPTDIMGSIQLEVTACDPNARADPSTCETDEAKVRDYLERNKIRVNIVTNFKNYNTQEY